MNLTGTVYKIVERASGKSYVGSTIGTLAQRWSAHVCDARRKDGPLQKAIRQHGRDAFRMVALEQGVPVDLLPERERHWIRRSKSVSPRGYNGNIGGSRMSAREDAIQRDAERISRDRTVSINTAKRWARLGTEPDIVRHPDQHGSTGTNLFKRWHGLKRRGAKVDPAWSTLAAFVESLGPSYRPDMRICRKDTALPWGPENFYFKEGWGNR